MNISSTFYVRQLCLHIHDLYIFMLHSTTLQAHSASGEFPSITLSAPEDRDDESDEEEGVQRDAVLDVGEVSWWVLKNFR